MPFIWAWWETSSWMGTEILSNAFSFSTEIMMWVFSLFFLLIWWITLQNFQMLSQPCLLGINHTWSWWSKFLHIVEMGSVVFYKRFLYLYSWGIIVYSFLSCSISAGFGINVMLCILSNTEITTASSFLY